METKYKPVIGTRYGSWTVISDQVKQGSIKTGTTQKNCLFGKLDVNVEENLGGVLIILLMVLLIAKKAVVKVLMT